MLLENELGAARAVFARGAFYFGFAVHIGEWYPDEVRVPHPSGNLGTGTCEEIDI
jgi:hypothetical protein